MPLKPTSRREAPVARYAMLLTMSKRARMSARAQHCRAMPEPACLERALDDSHEAFDRRRLRVARARANMPYMRKERKTLCQNQRMRQKV